MGLLCYIGSEKRRRGPRLISPASPQNLLRRCGFQDFWLSTTSFQRLAILSARTRWPHLYSRRVSHRALDQFQLFHSTKMRFLALLPTSLSIVAFVVTMMCIFAGSKPGFMVDYAVLTVSESLARCHDRS